MFPKNKVYLSRRNLEALLSKLDREEAGESTHCAIVKYKQPSPEFQQTMSAIMVIAVPDDDYYEAQNRPAGVMHPSDEVNLTVPTTGTGFGGIIL